MRQKGDAARARLNEQFANDGHVYTQFECGCLATVMYDEPETLRYFAKDLAKEVSAGRLPQKCAKGELPPANCERHERERQESLARHG